MSNNFDEQLRRQWEERHFPVDQQHRKEMISLLESNRRRKGIFWWFGGLALAIALGGGVLFLSKENSTQNVRPVLPATEKKNVEESTPLVSSSNAQSASSVDEGRNNIVNAKSSSLSVESKQTFKNNEKTSDRSHLPATIKSAKKTTTKKLHPTAHQAFQHPKKENVFSPAPNVNNTNAVVIPNVSPVIVSNAVAVVVLPEDADVMPSYAQEQRTAKVTSPLDPIFFSEVKDMSEFSFGINPGFTNYHSFSLYAEVGSGFIPGVKNEYTSGWTVNADGGAGYKTGEKTKVFLSAGYLMQNGGFDFERTSTVIQSGFGLRSNFNSLQPDKLHFIYSKLGFQYEVKRNIFSLSGGVQWLYGAQGTFTIRTTDQFSGITENSSYAWLSLNGMRRLLFNGEALYGYRIAPRITMNAGLKYYFSSITKEDPSLHAEGYSWNGQFSSFTPSFTINYHLYGKR